MSSVKIIAAIFNCVSMTVKYIGLLVRGAILLPYVF